MNISAWTIVTIAAGSFFVVQARAWTPLQESVAESTEKVELIPADSDKGKVRRRVLRKSSAPQICRQQSFGRDIGHAAAETYLITRLSFDLLGYLGYVFQFSLPHSPGYTYNVLRVPCAAGYR